MQSFQSNESANLFENIWQEQVPAWGVSLTDIGITCHVSSVTSIFK